MDTANTSNNSELLWTSTAKQFEQKSANASHNFINMMGFVYFILTAIMSALSIIGSTVIIHTYVQFPKLRTTCRKLLVYLSIADLLTAFGNLLGIIWYYAYRDDEDLVHTFGSLFLCKFQSGLTIFSSISSFFWTVAIAVYLHLSIVKNNHALADRFVLPFHVICWLLPCVIASIALGLNILGFDAEISHPSWCWIDPKVKNVLFWQYFTGKAWEIASYFIVVGLYASIKTYLLNQMRRTRESFGPGGCSAVIYEANRKLTWVPIIFIAVRIWGTIRFLIGAHAKDYAVHVNSAWIAPLQGIGDSAQGFANCIIFVMTDKKIRERLKRTCCKMRKLQASLSSIKSHKPSTNIHHQQQPTPSGDDLLNDFSQTEDHHGNQDCTREVALDESTC